MHFKRLMVIGAFAALTFFQPFVPTGMGVGPAVAQ